MTNSILRSLSVLLFLTVFAAPALAAPPGGNNPAIQDLMDEIDKLKTRVGDLETTIGQAKDAITALEASLGKAGTMIKKLELESRLSAEVAARKRAILKDAIVRHVITSHH